MPVEHGSPTTRQVFERLLEILQAKDGRKSFKEWKSKYKINKGYNCCLEVTRQLTQVVWDGHDAEFPTPATDYEPGTLEGAMTGIRKLLQIVCEREWPSVPEVVPSIRLEDKCQTVIINGGRSAQSEPLATKQHGQPFKRIVVLGKLWDTEFSAEFFRGVHAQADDLGIVIDDRRTDERTYVETESGDTESRLYAVVKELNPERDSTSLMIYMDEVDPIDYHCNELREEGFWIVTTGFTRGTVTEDSGVLGRKLAQCCIADETAWREGVRRQPAPRGVIVATLGGRSDAHYWSRRSGLNATLHRRSDLVKTIPLDLANLDLLRPGISSEVTTRLERLIQIEGGVGRIAAIFPRTQPLMEIVLAWIASNGANIRVYGERLITSDFALLRSDSPIAALCGIDPYHYGRYAVRAASCRWERSLPNAPPLLVSQKEAQRLRLNAVSRLPGIFDGIDVRMDDEQYAWASWMKVNSRENYGPDKFARASRQLLPPRP